MEGQKLLREKQDRIYAQGENTKEKEFNKEIIGSMTLPIPNGVSDQNAVKFLDKVH